MTTDIINTINHSFDNPQAITPANVEPEIKSAILSAMEDLNTGRQRIAEKRDGKWHVNQWLKKAVLLYFRIMDNDVMGDQYFDKVPLKFQGMSQSDFQTQGVRVVPPACVRYGAFVGSNTVLMPSYVNLGAYIDTGCMIDTWATVGSCAQIGKNVHVSGGAGIGGVLEPLQANPTIIEDNCFIGARSEIVEGVIVEENSVISMGVFIGQSTPVYDRKCDQIIYGRVPAGSVVVPGTLPSKTGNCQLYAAIIVKTVDEKTRAKVSVNDLLRNIEQ